MFWNWLTTLWGAPAVAMLGWALVAGFVGALWGLSEIVGSFKIETGRALRTGGAWMLIALNFGASAMIYILAANLLVGANGWLPAILVGLTWPTVFRNLTFKLSQPLNDDDVQEAAAVRIEESYRSVQALARQLINASLTRQRMKLVDKATQLSLEALAKKARMAVIAAPLPVSQGGPPDDYVNKIMERELEDDIKKAMLAAFILEFFDRDTLLDMLSARRGRQDA